MMKAKTIYIFPQGIGDGVMATAVAARYYELTGERMLIAHSHPELYENNPDIECHSEYAVQKLNAEVREEAERQGIKLVALSYLEFSNCDDGVWKFFTGTCNMLCRLAERAGLSGCFQALPRIFLTEEERHFGRFYEQNQIAVISQGIEQYKTWTLEKMQAVIQRFPDCHFVQLGAPTDVQLKGVHDLCGALSLRQVAAVLSNSRCFLGSHGALMHLARAVDCPAVILGSSAEDTALMAYPEFCNLAPKTKCTLCASRACNFMQCAFPEQCMDDISVEDVEEALRLELSHERKVLSATSYEIQAEPAMDLADYDRQYAEGKGLVKSIWVYEALSNQEARSPLGRSKPVRSVIRESKIGTDGLAVVDLMFNRRGLIHSVQICAARSNCYRLESVAVLCSGVARKLLSDDCFEASGAFCQKSGSSVWYLPYGSHLHICFRRKALTMESNGLGEVLEITLRVGKAEQWYSRWLLRLLPVVRKMVKLYDNRWCRKLLGKGY